MANHGIDIVEVARESGLEPRQSGGKHFVNCFSHPDSTPSLCLYPDNHCHCFACGFHGDVLDLVMALHGLNYPAALKYLNLSSDPMTPEERLRREELRRQREEKAALEKWRSTAICTLRMLLNATAQASRRIRTLEDAVVLAPVAKWEAMLEILFRGDPEELAALRNEYPNPGAI